VSPEFEFYVFQQSLFDSDPGRFFAEVIPAEGREHRERPGLGPVVSSGYHAPLAQDRLFALRNAMTRQIEAADVPVKYHHHEVGAFGQHEIELGFGGLRRMADVTLIVKSIVRGVAAEAGLTATFLPKPLFGEAGSGMHLHQYLVREGRNLFRSDDGLSELARCYIGGLLEHGRSLMALTNPSTNSYRRLVPGYEAPVYMVFGEANRSAAVRVPMYASGESKRIELRTMDATCNPYLAFSAILMAGIDGVRRGLDASELGYGPCEADCFTVQGMSRPGPRTLDEALDALAADHAYLTEGGVFTEEDVSRWIEVKHEESAAVAARPHPHEFTLYYDL
jgi:glutamine synthetase